MSGGVAAPLRHQNRPLTAIRGIAALWVVGHHFQFELAFLGYRYAGGIFRPGYLAVDFFFVLSGFVITAVHRDIGVDATSLRNFSLRRVFRIYPLHLFVLAVLLSFWLYGEAAHGTHDPTERLRDLPIVALLLQPYLIQEPSWNVVSWSAGVELACYLLFPFAMQGLRRLALPQCLMLLLITLLFAHHVESGFVWGWPAVLRGLAGFALGMTLQQASVLLPRPRAPMADLIVLGALAGLVISVALGHLGSVPIWSALLVFGLAAEAGRMARILGSAPLYGLGLISFSLYLLHPTLANLFFVWLPPAALPLPHALQVVVWLALILATLLALSTMSWAFIEEPARHFGARLARRQQHRSGQSVTALPRSPNNGR